jgi:hypothetical protein
VWSIGPGIHAAALTVETTADLAAEALQARIPADLRIVHATIEVRRRLPGGHDGS